MIPKADVDSGGSEQGLLGLAFHPNYANNKYYYVYYTTPATVIDRFTATDSFTTNVGNFPLLLYPL